MPIKQGVDPKMALEFNGQALDGMLQAKGWTYAEMGRRMGCSRQYVQSLAARKREPQMRTMNRLCAALGVEPMDLLKARDEAGEAEKKEGAEKGEAGIDNGEMLKIALENAVLMLAEKSGDGWLRRADTLDKRLRLELAVAGLSGKELARRSGLSEVGLNKIIAGKSKPRAKTIGKIAKGLGIDAAELLKLSPANAKWPIGDGKGEIGNGDAV
jgi:transcriptional regulator with XRE-family HTH domain